MTEPPPTAEPTPPQRAGMRSAILTQCFGCVGTLAFSNGLMLVYLRGLGLGSAAIIAALSMPFLAQALLQVPCAHLADRYGKKRLGFLGIGLTVGGFVLVLTAGLLPWPTLLAFGGVALYGLGLCCFEGAWYALLSPVVPEAMRGRFFGRLRFSWQLVGILFAVACSLLLGQETPLSILMVVIGVTTAMVATRLLFYAGIPELERSRRDGPTLLATLRHVLPANNYASFCCYVFLLVLFTGSGPVLFGLLEKDALNLSDQVVVVLGSLSMVGSLIGYYVGGKAVDRYGTKPVFVTCHAGYFLVLGSFLLRGLAPGLLVGALGALHIAFGLVSAASSIAISSEMLALIPPEGKAVSTSLLTMLMRAGVALSGLLSSQAIHLGVLAERWTIFGMELSQYDTLLLGCALMTGLLVVTLGLVPSVIGRSQWYPRGP